MEKIKNFLTIPLIVIFVVIIIPRILFSFISQTYIDFWANYMGVIAPSAMIFIVRWQIIKAEKVRKVDERKREKERKLGMLKYIEYATEKNLAKKKAHFYLVYCYTIKRSWSNEYEMFYEFNSHFIEQNYKIIFEFSFGKTILELESKIKKFNLSNNFLLENISKKSSCLENLKEKFSKEDFVDISYSTSKIKNLISLLSEISNVLFWIVGLGVKSEFINENKIYDILKQLQFEGLGNISERIKKSLKTSDVDLLYQCVKDTADELSWAISGSRDLNKIVNIEELQKYIYHETILNIPRLGLNVNDMFDQIENLKNNVSKEMKKLKNRS